ncbi:MAG: TauD/TfdA family dioxygenase [Pseudomonadota bacterium]
MITVKKLGAALGAEIRGLDLSAAPASNDDATALIDALHDHQVVVIRGSPLTPDDLLRCGELLGELTVHPVFPHLEGYPPIVVIENHGKQYAVNEHWHSDVMFSPKPPAYTLLHALDVPAVGGDTQFANQYLAYEGLSDEIKNNNRRPERRQYRSRCSKTRR